MKLTELKKYISEQVKIKLMPLGFKKDGFGNQLFKIETILNTPLKGEVKVYAGWIIKPNTADELILSTPFDGFVN